MVVVVPGDIFMIERRSFGLLVAFGPIFLRFFVVVNLRGKISISEDLWYNAWRPSLILGTCMLCWLVLIRRVSSTVYLKSE